MSLWEFRGLTADVRAGLVPALLRIIWHCTGERLTADIRAGLVPALCGATTRVARTPRNPKELIFFLSTEMKNTLYPIALERVRASSMARCIPLRSRTRQAMASVWPFSFKKFTFNRGTPCHLPKNEVGFSMDWIAFSGM